MTCHTRGAVALVCAFTVSVFSACDLGRIALPIRPSRLVIHGVLSATAPTQTVLVERTLTGEFATSSPFGPDGAEPIYSDGGNAERFATVKLILPSGDSIAARELASFSVLGNGGGIYVFALPGTSLVPGGRYKLYVRTTKQEVATAETIVPVATAVTTAPLVDFNRSTDTLALSLPPLTSANGYQLRVESPYGAWSVLTDSAHVRLTGDIRSVVNIGVPHVFIPGFRQQLTVSLVDANVNDYYRTTNKPSTGAGIISRVQGAYGVFGSLVTVSRRTLNVTATPTRPIEGTFDLVPGPLGMYAGFADAVSITLYVESPSTRREEPDAISASHRVSFGGFVGTALGTYAGNRLQLIFHRNQTMTDTLDILTAELRGDTLSGTFMKGAQVRYVRR